MVENGHFDHFWAQPGHFVGPAGPKWSKKRFFHKSIKCREKYTQTIVKTLAEFLFEKRDIYVPSDKFGIWIVPPLIVNQEEIDFLIPAIDDALEMADDWLRKNS